MSEENQVKTEVYRFDDCVLDADRRELRKAGETVTMQPKAFELLLFLVRNRHRAIDKDELQDTLWPRSIVTETALTRCVMKARRAVNDDADRQSVIKTVHGHGYRFIAAIRNDVAPAAATASPAAAVEPVRRRPALWAGTTGLVLAIAAIWWYLAPPASGADIRLAVLPIENATGDDELDWTRTGLMALMNRMLEDRGVVVVSENSVTDLAGQASLDELMPGDSEFQQTLRKTTAATHVIGAKLETDGSLYRLSYTFAGGDGKPAQRTVVGQEPAGLVRDVVTTIATLVTVGPPDMEHMSFVSSDDFLNEAYARAMSLQFEGRYAEAQRIFQVMVEQQPGLFWPRYEYALAARNLRDFDTAERLLIELREENEASGDSMKVAAVQNTLGILYMGRRRNEEAHAAFEDVLVHAEAADAYRYAAIAHINLGLLAKNTGDLQGGYEHMQIATKIYQDADIQSLPGVLLNNLSGVLIQLGRLDEAEQYSLQAIDNFRLTGKRLYESYALSRLASIYRRNGMLDDAENAAERAMSVRKELGDTSGVAASLITMSSIAADRGDITRSLQFARQASDIASEINQPDLTVAALLKIGNAHLLLQQPRDAAARYAAAEALARTIDDPTNVFAARYGIARAWIAIGDYDGAVAIANELQDEARALDHARNETAGLNLHAQIFMAREQWGAAIAPLEEVLQLAQSIGDNGIAAGAHLELARAWLEQDDIDKATTHADLVGAQRPADADLLRLQARIAAQRGDPSAAVRLMSDARTRAGETWRADDERRLSGYHDSVAAQTADAE